MLYQISFITAFLGLALWFFHPHGKWATLLRTLIIGSLVTYAGTLLAADAPAAYRLQTLLRDFLFIGVFGAAFSFLAGKRVWLVLSVLVSGLALFVYARQFLNASYPYREPIPLDAKGELLLEFREGVTPKDIQPLLDRYGLTATRAFYPEDPEFTDLDNYFVVDVPAKLAGKLTSISRQLDRTAEVIWVEENEQIQVNPLQSEPSKTAPGPSFYGLNDPGIANLWSFQQMDMARLYQILDQKKAQPAKKALIAILDTGVDAGHEDISSNYRSLKASNDNDPKGHGTHCAAIAAAVSNNGIGIASFSRDNRFTQVSSVKVLSAGGFGTQKSIIDGMLFAADKGADVLSMSLGGPINSTRQNAYDKAVSYARKKGAIVVVAAGNSNRNAREFSPANASGVICVSAVNQSLDRAEFSNYVQDIPMAVAAPGVDIYSAIPGNQYTRYSGTSMATPYVAGLLGLMKSLRPELDADQAYAILSQSGKDTRNTKMTGKFILPGATAQALLGK